MATETQMARALDAPGVVQMTVRGVKKALEELSPSEVATWLEEQGLGHLAPSFKHHKIRGKYLVTLTRDDLKDMGIELVGDQKAIMDELSQLKRAVVRVLRDQILWTGREQLFDNCCQKAMGTCCGLCPIPPAQYTLTNQALKITNVEIFRCCNGWCRCACCGVDQSVNNIDLNYIKDVDFLRNSGCCLDQGIIRVEADLGTDSKHTEMKIDGADAAEVVTLIKNAVEDAKMRREKGRAFGQP
eukprot:CAMPEP_0177777058 /NCGR_PEP_ID=MMETSP0491_2-20121128/15071_1 /TAXON_ID=63592 /ORGANISM="Tetraselmis chuii, Strain PLY429" /LENGTH=242 /DNA_ID=CAMNT_0019295945 /DNA_START=361 /DNA_END=1089 /DNA_ORIENTATION=-